MDVIKSKREKVKANKVNCVNKVSKEKEREKGKETEDMAAASSSCFFSFQMVVKSVL